MKTVSNSYDKAAELLEKEFNFVVCQTRVNNNHNDPHVEKYKMVTISSGAALSTVYKRILSLSRWVTLSHKNKAYRIEILYGTATKYRRARKPGNRVATAGILLLI